MSEIYAGAGVAPIAELERKTEFWKKELLDTGKRNKMINYRETKRTTLQIREPGASELFHRLANAGDTLTFQKPISKESDIRTYAMLALLETLSYSLPVTNGDIKTEGTIIEREKTLKNLRAKAKLAQEEQGINILYLCFGFIYWKEKAGGDWIKSPLLMMPVTLGLKSLNSSFTLTKGDDEIEVNPTLDYLFNADYNIDLPTFELKNQGDAFGEYMRTVEQIVDKRGWKVVPEVSLGLLSFLKISMYHDLNNNADLINRHPVLRAMAGNRSSLACIPEEVQHYDFDTADPHDWHEVINSDSSQEEAILLSKKGISFVMQGPPGTGKSQTITNIISEAMADGKKILFVSEKSAALQVVLRRLTEVGLNDFCLSLHDYKANKKEIIDNIGQNLSLQPEYIADSELAVLTKLLHDREYLDKYASELHEPIDPLGDSVYMALGKLARLEKATQIDFSINNIMEVSRESFLAMKDRVAAFERVLHSMDGKLSCNPWYGTNATSAGQVYKQQLLSQTGGMAVELRRMAEITAMLRAEYKFDAGYTPDEIRGKITELDAALALPLFDLSWTDAGKRAIMLNLARNEQAVQAEFYAAREEIRKVFTDNILNAPLNEWIEQTKALRSTFRSMGFESDAVFSDALKNIRTIDAVRDSLRKISAQYAAVNDVLHAGECDSFDNIIKTCAITGQLKACPADIRQAWFRRDFREKAKAQLALAEGYADRLKTAKAALGSAWSDDIIYIDIEDIAHCFAPELIWPGMDKNSDMRSQLCSAADAAKGVSNELHILLAAFDKAKRFLNAEIPDTMESLRIFAGVLSYLNSPCALQCRWFDLSRAQEYADLLQSGAEKSAFIERMRAKIQQTWIQDIYQLDAGDMLAKFKESYTDEFIAARLQYIDDIRSMAACSKSGTPSKQEIVDALQKVIQIEQDWLSFNDMKVPGKLHEHMVANSAYAGTDWDKLRAGLAGAISEAAEHGRLAGGKRAEILKEWEPSVFELDIDQLLKRFKTEYIGFFRKIKPAYRTDIQALRLKYKGLMNADEAAIIENLYKIKDCIESEKWFDENAERLKAILGARYNGLNTDWANLLTEVNTFIDGAIERDALIRDAENALLINWDRGLFNLDADAMLARFRVNYTEEFLSMIPAYERDEEQIIRCSKTGSVNREQIIGIAVKLKELQSEMSWFEENRAKFTEALGPDYNGADTNWPGIKERVGIAGSIAGLFPYGMIPQSAVLEICRISCDTESIAEACRLADTLNAERLSNAEKLIIASACVPDYSCSEVSLAECCTAIDKMAGDFTAQLDKTAALAGYKLNGTLSYADVDGLIKHIYAVQRGVNWFAGNRVQNEEYLANGCDAPDNDWTKISQGINFAEQLCGIYGCESLDADLAACVCAEDERRRLIAAFDGISADEIQRVRGNLEAVAAQLNKGDVSISEGITSILEQYDAAHSELCECIENVGACIPCGFEAIGKTADMLIASCGYTPEYLFSMLDAAANVRAKLDAIESRSMQLKEIFGQWFIGVDTAWKKLADSITEVEKFMAEDHQSISADFVEIYCNNQNARRVLADGLTELMQLNGATTPKLAVFDAQFDNAGFEHQKFEMIADKYEACINDFGSLNCWFDYVEIRAECDKAGLGDFTAKIASADNTINDVCDAFEYGFYRRWIGLAVAQMPYVEKFRKRVHEDKVKAFIAADEKQFNISRERIRQKIISGIPCLGRSDVDGQIIKLHKEMGKKRAIMPLRKLFREIPDLLLALKPCLMMSPLSVAYFLEADLYKFDMVIFDEASQIFPQDAIGAIFRGKQVVIAGDTKQLPPTSFFAGRLGNDDEFDTDDDSYTEEMFDSILEETAGILPNRTLLWHYRSRHEQLIAFSNHEIYNDQLVTFPSSNESEKDTGVEFAYVDDGYYEGAGRNTVEARRCVELVREHIEHHPKRSLGIIAFSEKQQNTIATEIQRFRESNPKYEYFFAEGRDEEFFIKNLENVQGDERDTIIFSISYAQTKEQKEHNRPMAMRFGPLGQQGGERRLNVAITRAKTNIKLVSSIKPSDIDLDKVKSDGVRMLRSYIEFAMNGNVALAASGLNHKPDDFADMIAAFLRKRGYVVKQYIGCSGYKIDIAIEHPSGLLNKFVAGIECDGYSYASARTARDRDRLRGSVLKAMGWNMYRIWSAEWHKNPEIEGNKLIAFVDAALAKCDEQVKKLETEKHHAEEARRKAEEKRQTEEVRRKEEEKRQATEVRRKAETERQAEKVRRKAEAEERQATEARRKAETERQTEEKRQAEEARTNINEEIQKRHEWSKEMRDAREKKSAGATAKCEENVQRPANESRQTSGVGKDSPEELIAELHKRNYDVTDNRDTSGIVWVIYSALKRDEFEKLIAGYNVYYKYEKRGSVATYNCPAWRIMFNTAKNGG